MAQYRIHDRMYKVMEYAEYKRIIYDPGVVSRIILHRPRYRNALSHPTLSEIEHAFNRAAADRECRVIVMSGDGICFSTGDDVFGLSPESPPVMADERTPQQLMEDYGSEGEVWRQFQEEHFDLLHGMHGRLRRIPKPTIAMVHGWCIFNAYNMAATMDLVFASEDALFMPAGPQVWDLGPRKALEILYEHRFLSARECCDLGLVTRVYPTREILEKETLAFAYRVAEQPPTQLLRAKESVQHIMDCQGWTAAYDDNLMMGLAAGGGPALPIRTVPTEERHRERYEGRGMARTPRALANLKARFESQGAETPQHVLDALARAAARDDRGSWERALHQDWREKEHLNRADAGAAAYDTAVASFRAKVAEERARRGL